MGCGLPVDDCRNLECWCWYATRLLCCLLLDHGIPGGWRRTGAIRRWKRVSRRDLDRNWLSTSLLQFPDPSNFSIIGVIWNLEGFRDLVAQSRKIKMTGLDFVHYFAIDLVLEIFAYLEDSDDLVRCSAVSHRWNRFVIENSLCKNLAIRLHPEVSVFYQATVVKDSWDSVEELCGKSNEWESLKCEHRVYSLITHNLKISAPNKECILRTIAASSTDNYPDEGIENTTNPSDFQGPRPSYWSSTGSKDSQKPETLTYELISDLCIVDEINIKPFQAYFQHGFPLYSAKAVRFKMGHLNCSTVPLENNTSMANTSQESPNDPFFWSYISPLYPMVHENRLQSFKLPKPVLCTGGIFQVEFLGRVQTQEIDDLYYICMSHVQVFGCPPPSKFNIHYFGNSERLVLKYNPHASNPKNEEKPHESTSKSYSWICATTERLGLRRGVDVAEDSDEEEEDSDSQ